MQSYGEPGTNQLLIRLPQTAQTEQGASLSADVPKVEQMLKAGGLPAFKIEGTEIVGPTVGAELRRKAIYATLLSMLGITAWIAIPLPRQLRARLDHRDVPRRVRHARVPGVLPATRCRSTSSRPC